MTEEQKKQLEKEATAANGYMIYAKNTKAPPFNEGYMVAATKYSAIIEEKNKEIERLQNWKIQSTELLTPLLEYGQGHKDIPLGKSITEYILMWAKKYHEQQEEIERLKAIIETLHTEARGMAPQLWLNFKQQHNL